MKGTKGKRKHKRVQHWQVVSVGLFIYDAIAVNAAYLIALWLRFDCQYMRIPEVLLVGFLKFSPLYTVFCLLVFLYARLYNSIWRFASYTELIHIGCATIITGLFHTIGITVLYQRMPIFYYIVGIILQFLLVLGVRFAYRFILLLRGQRKKNRKKSPSNVMLIGAGAAGRMILRDLHKGSESIGQVRCIIDDNANKWNRFIDNVPVVGGREDILVNCKKYKIEKIYFAIPSASAEDKRDILNICKESGCELKTLPGIYQLVSGEVTVDSMKEVALEDLLGRAPIQVDMTEIFRFLAGKVILVTGGGGSIGSELCRQIASHHPRMLIIFDVYENNAYDIQQELKMKYPELNLKVLIGSVRDSRRIRQVFSQYRPDIVYHAAAHKHVPLMEGSPSEAIKNNAIGTYKTAYAAMMNGCQRFVLISTDKAVNPTNIMGASKRLCEMVVQAFDRCIKEGNVEKLPLLYAHAEDEVGGMKRMDRSVRPKTEFVAVRFGNVLGSNGSVIPLFKKQIAAGGPVTVTHPDIIRYFMTIQEAVSLVLQAGTYARGGEIFVLDMGSPVKIDTLARNLIKLSGYKPDVDIKVEYTGLRPGEKLYEEKLMAEEGMTTTPNHMIYIGKPIPFDTDEFLVELQSLMQAAYENEDNIRELTARIVGTYHPLGNDSSGSGDE